MNRKGPLKEKLKLNDESLRIELGPLFEKEDFSLDVKNKLQSIYDELIKNLKKDTWVKFNKSIDTNISIPDPHHWDGMGIVRKADFKSRQHYIFFVEVINSINDFFSNFFQYKICAKEINLDREDLQDYINKLSKMRDSNVFAFQMNQHHFNAIIESLELQKGEIVDTTNKSLIKSLTKEIANSMQRIFGKRKAKIILNIYDVIFPNIAIEESHIRDHFR